MAFNDEAHRERLGKLNQMWQSLKPLSDFAKEQFGIDDIFQDNDGKVMQQLTCLDFFNLEGREGNDGKDENGVEWEMKSVNVSKTSAISTHHHLNTKIIEKYRKVPWTFAVYNGVELLEIYAIHPDKLNIEYFNKWEKDVIENSRELNNPKINLEFIRNNAELIFNKDHLLIKDPKSIYDDEFMMSNLEYDFSPSTTRSVEEIKSELDNLTMNLSDEIVKIEQNNVIEYIINEIEFLKIISFNNHLNLCMYLDENVSKENGLLSLTKGKEKESMGKSTSNPKYNYKYKLGNKKAVLDEPFEFIKISYSYSLSKKSVQLDLC